MHFAIPESDPWKMNEEIDLLKWLELSDVKNRGFSGRTWIPLCSSEYDGRVGEFGWAGHRKDYESIETAVCFLSCRDQLQNSGWNSINKNGNDAAWANDTLYLAPGTLRNDDEEIIGFYPVLRKGFDTGEKTEWVLSQEIEFALGLLRRGDIWVRPEEDYVEVVRLHRDSDGIPVRVEMRAEHLRDFLCARKATLLMTGFRVRDAVENTLDHIPWDEDQHIDFDSGEWDGTKRQILEGGMPVGSTTAVFHMWRESVDPSDDVPLMLHPTEETAARSSERIVRHDGNRLECACGKIWWKQWIEPAARSCRVAGDWPEPTVPFFVDNQGGEKLSGQKLSDYQGWLWFRPEIIRELLQHEGGFLKWHTGSTGSVGPAENRALHFGTNKLGLINVLGYKMAQLPEWTQRLWSGFSVVPEGGLSEELHASQNLADPAHTIPPEVMLYTNLIAVEQAMQETTGVSLYAHPCEEKAFYRSIHRFYDHSFSEVCTLAKLLKKMVIERLKRESVNRLLGSQLPNTPEKLGEIKRLEKWLNAHGEDGRSITGPLVGINDLRQGDAHNGESTARKALQIFGIPSTDDNYQQMNICVLGSVAWSLGWITKTILDKGPLP